VKRVVGIFNGISRFRYHLLLNSDLPAIVFLGDREQAEIGDEANPLNNQFVTEIREILNSEDEPLVRYNHCVS